MKLKNLNLNNLKRNKKGFAQAILDLAAALVVILVAILLFGFMTRVNEQAKIQKGKEFMAQAVNENNVALYFKLPVEVDGQTLTMAELIALTADTGSKSYERLWRGTTWNYFSKLGYNMAKLRVFVNKPNCNFNCGIFGGDLSGEYRIGASPHTPDLPDIHSIVYIPSQSRLLEVEIVYAPH